jgi:hypothetical protein
MDYLRLEFDSTLKMSTYNYDVPPSSFAENGVNYTLAASQCLFDWLVGPSGQVVGIELHTVEMEGILEKCGNIDELPYVTRDGFVTVWFGSARSGVPKFCGDWEDYYYLSRDGRLIVLLGLHMLLPDEVVTLTKKP